MQGVKIIESEIDGLKIPISRAGENTIDDNYFTVIIGTNASGKSRLLVNILNTLRRVSNPRLKSKSNITKLTIELGDQVIFLDDEDHPMSISEDLKHLNLISISNSLFDKFPHQAKTDTNYSYIGSRMVGLSTHKRSIVNDLMDVFSENLDDNNFIDKAIQLFEFLQIPPIIRISLRISNISGRGKLDELLHRAQNPQELKDFLFEISQRGFYRQQAKKLASLVENDYFIEGLYNFLNNDFRQIRNSSAHERLEYEIDLTNKIKNESFIKEYKYFSLLRRLNFITYDYIKLNKNGYEYDILESSTGEIGLLTTFVRAIPEMESNSVIFIDEPEISLHPSWQMRYVELLKKFLAGYSGCHILIATHSHFLLSDLKDAWSSVLILKNNNGTIEANLKKKTPFGWSPEAILYDVFEVSTVRNHYFEKDLRLLLSLISNRSKDHNNIENLIASFKKFDYLKGDPLEKIISEAENYLKK
ncbi:MAG: AAA family ATPase [Flavobacteriaceae bacterium]